MCCILVVDKGGGELLFQNNSNTVTQISSVSDGLAGLPPIVKFRFLLKVCRDFLTMKVKYFGLFTMTFSIVEFKRST